MPSVLIMRPDPQVAEDLRRQVELLGHEAIVVDSVSEAIRILSSPDAMTAATDSDIDASDKAVEQADHGERPESTADAIHSVLIEPADMRQAARVGEISDKRALRGRDSSPSLWVGWRAWLMALVSHYHVPAAMVAGAIVTLLLLWVGQAIWGGEAEPRDQPDPYGQLTANATHEAELERRPEALPQEAPAAVEQPILNPVEPPLGSNIEQPQARPRSNKTDWLIRAKWRRAPASKGVGSKGVGAARVDRGVPPGVPQQQLPSASSKTPPTDNIDPWAP
jgi:hypothetical protein